MSVSGFHQDATRAQGSPEDEFSLSHRFYMYIAQHLQGHYGFGWIYGGLVPSSTVQTVAIDVENAAEARTNGEVKSCSPKTRKDGWMTGTNMTQMREVERWSGLRHQGVSIPAL
jgi:hypothetical protein